MKKIYALETGAILRKSDKDYQAYKQVYGKEFSMYDEDIDYSERTNDLFSIGSHYLDYYDKSTILYMVITEQWVDDDVVIYGHKCYKSYEDIMNDYSLDVCDVMDYNADILFGFAVINGNIIALEDLKKEKEIYNL